MSPSLRTRRAIGARMSHAVLAFAVVAATAAASTRANAQQSPDLAAFDKYVAHAARDWRVPGLAIAIVKDDSLVFARGYGVTEVGKSTPATEHTRFAIASTTKAMTVAALAMLVDEGKLHWDDHVIDYLPDFRMYDPFVTREMTVRDLLTHRSGLPNVDLLWVHGDYTLADIMRRLRYVKPETSFRSQFEYQNVMYAVAGAVVTRVSGIPWDEFVRTRIFAPLGMTESTTALSTILGQPGVAVPNALVRDTLRALPFDSKDDAIAPAGSVWSSVSDMSKWMRFILDSGRVGTKRLIQPATFAEMVAPQIRAPLSEYPALQLAQPHFFSYALGWFVQDYHGQTVWMHTGSIDGMSAIIGLIPSQRLGVYVLENLDHAELRHALMYEVFDLYNPRAAGNPPRDWSADVRALFATLRSQQVAPTPVATGTHPSLPLERYVGTYTDSVYGTLAVTLVNGALHARFEKEDLGVLTPLEYDSFRAPTALPWEDPEVVTFVPDGAGQVSGVHLFDQAFVRTRAPGSGN